jgi:AcrR family transcriptional regulator
MTPTRSGVRAAAQQRRAATEQAILDATEALLEERPFWELNVEEVMATAGLGRTAFYRYFHDLESVVVRLMGTLVDELHEASSSWTSSAAEDAADQLREAIRRFAAVYRDHGRLMKAFDDAVGSSPNLKDLWGETVSTLIGPVESHVQTLTAAGRVTVDHPIETIRALAVLTDSYLLDVYWAHDRVEVEQPTAVLCQIWTRTLRLG